MISYTEAHYCALTDLGEDCKYNDTTDKHWKACVDCDCCLSKWPTVEEFEKELPEWAPWDGAFYYVQQVSDYEGKWVMPKLEVGLAVPQDTKITRYSKGRCACTNRGTPPMDLDFWGLD